MRIAPLLLTALLPLTSSGCIAVMAGAVLAADADSRRNNREAFTSNFHRTNLDRESVGLAPLDWCSTVYTFDRGWSLDMPVCADRVYAYEDGDKSALDLPEDEE